MKIFLFFTLTFLTSFVSRAQENPIKLGEAWVEAIQSNSTEKMKKLFHPECLKQKSIQTVIQRMASGPLPKKYSLETNELTASAEQLKLVYLILPKKQLSIKYLVDTREEKQKYGLGKTLPIVLFGKNWLFSCQKEFTDE